MSLAVLGGDEQSLPPRARALSGFAALLTIRPWDASGQDIAGLRQHGIDEEQIETAVGVIAMFNYFTRVADATGIEFDYPTPLPAFAPDACQLAAARPARPTGDGAPVAGRPVPAADRLRTMWGAWRSCLLDADEPLGSGRCRLVASVAAEESGDWEAAAELSSPRDVDDELTGFARKLSREPWQMAENDLDALRKAGYEERALLHIIAIVAHQNADSRLVAGLRAARQG